MRAPAAQRWALPQLAAITPQYIEGVLRGALSGNQVQQWELFDLMLDTWPELASCAQELRDGVLRKRLVFEPFAEEGESPTPEAIQRCALVSAAMRRMQPDPCADENDLDGTMSDILDGWFRGVTAIEVLWQRVSAGKLGEIIAPRATVWAHPVNFAWSDEGRLGLRGAGLGGMRGQIPETRYQSGIVEFPANKFLIGIHKAKAGNALGGSVLRPLAWWWCAANFASDWLLNLAQLFGLPFRWATYDPNAAPATIDAICNMLQNMGSNAYAAFPEGTQLELKHANASGDHSPQGELLDRADRYARLLLLGQTMSGGQDASKGGGKAFGAVESKVKDERIDAAGKYTCSVLGQQVRSILVLNYGDADEAPTAKLVDEQEAGSDDATRDVALAGLMPLSIPHLRRKYNQPEPAKGEESTDKHKAKPVEKMPGAGGQVPGNEKAPGKPGESGDSRSQEEEDEAEADADEIEELKAKLGELSAIEDDALFAKQLHALVARGAERAGAE